MKNIDKIREFIAKWGDLARLDENGRYNDNLSLSNNQLTEVSFPEGMTIGGGLSLSNNQLTEVSFPEGMTIETKYNIGDEVWWY